MYVCNNVIQMERANTKLLSGMVEGTKFRIFSHGTYVQKGLGSTHWSMKFAPGGLTTARGCLARL